MKIFRQTKNFFAPGNLLLAITLVFLTGCGSFMAQRLAQAPNSYPTWFAPDARVTLGFNNRFLRDIPRQTVPVGYPKAELSYRVVEPASYQMTFTERVELDHGWTNYTFAFDAKLPPGTNQWTSSPRGTVFLLHGYGLAQFSMAPWALKLAGEGWRCVLVDLRGHGKSTGRKIYFGLVETGDLTQLMNRLAAQNKLAGPVSVIGESYGGALALRWKTVEPRLKNVVAIAPYNNLSNAVMNIARDYADWVPRGIIRRGVKNLPEIYGVKPVDLDTASVLKQNPLQCLIIAGGDDAIVPPDEESQLAQLAAPGSKLVVVPNASHEAVTYFFNEIAPAILDWLNKSTANVGGSQNHVLP